MFLTTKEFRFLKFVFTIFSIQDFSEEYVEIISFRNHSAFPRQADNIFCSTKWQHIFQVHYLWRGCQLGCEIIGYYCMASSEAWKLFHLFTEGHWIGWVAVKSEKKVIMGMSNMKNVEQRTISCRKEIIIILKFQRSKRYRKNCKWF